MTDASKQEFDSLREQIIMAQSQVPAGSIDWDIYQGQLDLMDKIANMLGITCTAFKSYLGGRVVEM